MTNCYSCANGIHTQCSEHERMVEDEAGPFECTCPRCNVEEREVNDD